MNEGYPELCTAFGPFGRPCFVRCKGSATNSCIKTTPLDVTVQFLQKGYDHSRMVRLTS
jgi:hypothetical protein